jgi:hypothetical protein
MISVNDFLLKTAVQIKHAGKMKTLPNINAQLNASLVLIGA